MFAGADLCRQVMKKKMEADQFCLQLQTLPFGAALKEELGKFATRFESGACEFKAGVFPAAIVLDTQINALVSTQNDHEATYIPHVRSFIQACQDYEGPKKAADGMVKSMKRKAPSAKQPKAKAAKTA